MTKQLATTQNIRFAVCDEPDLTAEEARALFDKSKEGLSDAGDAMTKLSRRNGWKALGYSSWAEAARVEYGMTKSTAWRLAIGADVEEVIGVVIPGRHAAIYNALPAPLQRSAYERAQQLAAGGKVTSDIVRQAVSEIAGVLPPEDRDEQDQTPAGEEKRVTGRTLDAPAKDKGAGSTPDQQADKRESKRDKWDRAMATLKTVIHPKLYKAIEKGDVSNLTRDADIILWVQDEQGIARDAGDIRQIERLVTGADGLDPCTVPKAIALLNAMPDDKTRFQQAHCLAIAQGGALFVRVGGAIHLTVNIDAAGKAYDKQLEKLAQEINDNARRTKK